MTGMSAAAAPLIAALLATFIEFSVTSDEVAVADSSLLLGLDCNEVTPCTALHENCKNGYCKCKDGHIRNQHHCFPEREYGETCFFDIQCTIHPMVCLGEEKGVKRCDCHRFYNWSSELQVCVHAENVSAMISELEERKFSAARIEQEAKHIFPGVLTAGLLVLVLGAVFATFCFAYGCFWDKRSFFCQHTIQDDTGELDDIVVAEEPTTSAAAPPSSPK